ncbi:peptidylprolyl isomerase [Croceivirga sp. JEA036]|uniref:peptidylprolyl isomerase n=1 Tax=Croceivirga sp. JEA036 TaxID=2721162 RepID=UPI00143980FC|nr:peptidylprolyl isomerase [Croceivirga sp. JEA036]NJB34985.1 peptidylprolyl isomerase [Croceivirga sp. JEA036]
MRVLKIALTTSLLLILFTHCGDAPKKNKKKAVATGQSKSNDTSKTAEDTVDKIEKAQDTFELTEENAIDFFFDYAKSLKENKVKITTTKGSFTVELYDNVPYHKANFIYLTKQKYFDSTQFHRVVPNFIIQGGNSDDKRTSRKRSKIGRYLLPPDTRKGHKHHRGTISMPSSERDNPHKLASPFEFFIVVTDPGSYHLDGDYTAFGKVIEGMDIVDKINQTPIDSGEWPMRNIYILKAEVID